MFSSAQLTSSWSGTFTTSAGASCATVSELGDDSTSTTSSNSGTAATSADASEDTSQHITGAGGDMLDIQSGDAADSSGEDSTVAQQGEATEQTAARSSAQGTSATGQSLTREEQATVQKLQGIDRQVHNHEQAHLAAAGGYATGGASYETIRGPDGKEYAIGGEVPIDVSPVRDNPQATIRKAQVVRAAALAPADPSAQDRSVAAAASQIAAEARAELAVQQREELQGGTESSDGSTTDSSSGSAAGSSDGSDTQSRDDTDKSSDTTSVGSLLNVVA